MVIKSIFAALRRRPYRNIFFLLMAVILVDAIAPNAVMRGLFADLMFAAILLIAVVETVRTRRNARWALILGLPAVIARIIVAFLPDARVQNAVVLFLSAVFMLFLVWNILHDLSGERRPTDERIFGALSAYVFIGLLFALIYTHMEYRQPGSFTSSNETFIEEVTSEANLYPLFTYYSFVTITTLGYGDITPVAEHARILTWFEALLGQLYLAVMVAGLVAVHISENAYKKRDAESTDASD